MGETEAVKELGSVEKARLTLKLAPDVRDLLKQQARRMGISASAYVTLLVTQKKVREVLGMDG